ncbi:MAG TPA: hypothetical protein VMY99_02480 [Nevskiaceae bacterium]|nr:hypothetical protein [Nevskiaceae bacterium]
MSEIPHLPKITITESLILVAIPPFTYLLLWIYYLPQFSHYNVPLGLFRPDPTQALLFGASLSITFALVYMLGQLISMLVPAHGPILLRIRRFVGIMMVPELLFAGIILLGEDYSTQNDGVFVLILFLQIVVSPLSLYLLISDFIVPLIHYRKIKGLRAKFSQPSDIVMYQKPSTFLLKKVRVMLPVFALLIVYTVAYMGNHATESHRYMVINTNPKQVVLINYGDKMLVAELTEKTVSYPSYSHTSYGSATEYTDKQYKQTVYKHNFRLLDADNLDTTSFIYKDFSRPIPAE